MPPKYTGGSESTHPGNITDIPVPEGSHLRISGKSTKTLDSAWIMLNDNRHNLFAENPNQDIIFQQVKKILK